MGDVFVFKRKSNLQILRNEVINLSSYIEWNKKNQVHRAVRRRDR